MAETMTLKEPRGFPGLTQEAAAHKAGLALRTRESSTPTS